MGLNVAHVGLLSFGKTSAPTAPAGATPPAQFVPLDQSLAVALVGVAPLHLKMLGAEDDASAVEAAPSAIGTRTAVAIPTRELRHPRRREKRIG